MDKLNEMYHSGDTLSAQKVRNVSIPSDEIEKSEPFKIHLRIKTIEMYLCQDTLQREIVAYVSLTVACCKKPNHVYIR